MIRNRKRVMAIGAILLVALAVRGALPVIVERELTRKLDGMTGYNAHIDDVDLWLVGGAYAIDGLVILRDGASAPVPFVDIARVDLSVQWRALLQGSLVGEVKAWHPIVHFTNGPDEDDDQAGSGVDWRAELQALFPLPINRFAVYDGEIHFADFSMNPPVDLDVRHLEAEARNLASSDLRSGLLSATVDATGAPLGLGRFAMHADVDPHAEQPTFDLALQLHDVDLRGLSPFLKLYTGFEAERGLLSLDTEITCDGGTVVGFVEPVLEDVYVYAVKETQELLGSRESARTESKIPIAGSIDDLDARGWPAVFSLLGNAWLQALGSRLDHVVSLRDGVRSASADRAPAELTERPRQKGER